ncbi:hypothetical protein AOQ84DRAFT_379277 [Glonium stellatum]|uniref:Uncharacterized protein n=1 Tax=Glonium stellatum TaxID=574774 RepID=A0A8E2EWS0_9PEZI|nr:hypothetical protein AOQ84DRAFT_379277 [Glonium stellatum]
MAHCGEVASITWLLALLAISQPTGFYDGDPWAMVQNGRDAGARSPPVTGPSTCLAAGSASFKCQASLQPQQQEGGEMKHESAF